MEYTAGEIPMGANYAQRVLDGSYNIVGCRRHRIGEEDNGRFYHPFDPEEVELDALSDLEHATHGHLPDGDHSVSALKL